MESLSLSEIDVAVEKFLAGFEAGECSTAQAAAAMKVATRIENRMSVLKAFFAARATESSGWRDSGARSEAEWYAQQTGTSTGEAARSLKAAKTAERSAKFDAAARAGKLSATQAGEVADAAAANPDAEDDLLAAAESGSVKALKDACQAAKQAGHRAQDDKARHERMRRARHFRRWTDRDGTPRFAGSSTPEQMAQLMAALEPLATQKAVANLKAGGDREPYEASLHDALVERATATSGQAGPSSAKVIARVDAAAWERGATQRGETCEITGLGPVPVASIDALVRAGAMVALLATRGTDVASVMHLGRHPTALQRTALEWSQPGCEVFNCPRTARLEVDHHIGWAQTKRTELFDLGHKCPYHHDLKSHHGWTESPGPLPNTIRMHPPNRVPVTACDRLDI